MRWTVKVSDELAKVHGRVLGATDQEIEHATEAAAAALKHPLLERARKSKLAGENCRFY